MSSSFVTPMARRQRQSFDPRTGKQTPYRPYMTPGQKLPRVFMISKVRKPNPYLINAHHFAHY